MSVYKVRKGQIRRTSIICNDLIYRPLQSVRKCKPCGQTDRQVCIDVNRYSVLQTEDNLLCGEDRSQENNISLFFIFVEDKLSRMPETDQKHQASARRTNGHPNAIHTSINLRIVFSKTV